MRDLWVSENLCHLFGLGSVAESREEYDRRRHTHRSVCDPEGTVLADASEPDRSTDWKTLPVVLVAEKSQLYWEFDKTEELDSEQTVDEIVCQYEKEDAKYRDIEDVIGMKLVAGNRSKEGEWANQVFIDQFDEKRILKPPRKVRP